MGLDMYVRASKYVSGYSFRDDDVRQEFRTLVDLFGVSEYVDPHTPSGNVEFVVAYWRKANHIHSWFVRECQNGVDECQVTSISREKIGELRELCLRVLASRSVKVAEELLAPQEGFFFGSVDLGESDEWYWQDTEDTVKQLDRILSMPEGWSFVYQSSW